ncbi:MAG TPA: YbaK/EbsC family protein [Parvularculaceae bacterium]|nr:YbaK/EbsC family protein [Parvularculaceae bacterium]
MDTPDTYSRLLSLLDEHAAQYRLIEHPPEGRTEIVSGMRGHPVAQAAKCIVVMVKIGKKTTKFILAVIPGDARLDMNAVRTLMRGTYAGFAPPERAEELAKSVVGTVLPFVFDSRLELIVDQKIAQFDEIFFNAARLDRSLALKTADYLKIAKPRLVSISAP